MMKAVIVLFVDSIVDSIVYSIVDSITYCKMIRALVSSRVSRLSTVDPIVDAVGLSPRGMMCVVL